MNIRRRPPASPPDDLHRLIQEVLARSGFEADAAQVSRGVRKLNYGLPAEDEFSVICAWLGRCRLVHKLDQQQAPPSSRKHLQVPDLLAAFEGSPPVLIEVKVCNDQTLSMKPGYHQALCAYADLVGRPLLVAWKCHNLWTLIEIGAFKIARTNFNLRHEEAMKKNLLGVLAGDVAYSLRPQAGIHFEMSKEQLLKRTKTSEGWTEQWQMRIADAYLTDGSGIRRTDLHLETQQILATWPHDDNEIHSDTQIRKSFVAGDGQIQFAHNALVNLLAWESARDKPHWRGLLTTPRITRTIEDFRTALDRALEEGVVQYIFNQQPTEWPSFLKASRESKALKGC